MNKTFKSINIFQLKAFFQRGNIWLIFCGFYFVQTEHAGVRFRNYISGLTRNSIHVKLAHMAVLKLQKAV